MAEKVRGGFGGKVANRKIADSSLLIDDSEEETTEIRGEREKGEIADSLLLIADRN
jgi:hypothetical protein